MSDLVRSADLDALALAIASAITDSVDGTILGHPCIRTEAVTAVQAMVRRHLATLEAP